ncbi:MAG TPA: nitrogenase cofactor biosynthesis protein NifB [Kineosporiaceae bacterium]|nr:nitrogenase cofactor biosynthesis protein NifB [Kineosporiaceae bacterium]
MTVPLTLLPRRPDPQPAPARGCASTSSCGTSSSGLDPALAARVASHPCYSQEAHRYYARMHVPVAPGCNIQCHYCNRKFDCANESRPGVTSALLTPEQALAKVKQVAGKVPQLSVVGIAGPGEPLANARRTLGTLELLSRHTPDLTLCLSTNGLALPDHVDRIAALGVDHVTVTVNMTDPEIGARIYPWITMGGKRYTGVEAARRLSQRQLEGIAALRDRGILCKVNSVLIPGINDEHLVEVSRTVRELGAFLHNVMPLVSAPEHGTVFGLAGIRGPSPQELLALQRRCEELSAPGGPGTGTGSMGLMRHCRQCRADAVGLLGEDRGEEFAGLGDLDPDAVPYDLAGRREAHARIERDRAQARRRRAAHGVTGEPGQRPGRTVLVAVATSGGGLVDQHFGHAQEFSVYEAAPGWARLAGIRSVSRYCHGPGDCDDDRSVLERTVELLSDCVAVLCSRVGAQPRRALAAAGIEAVEVYEEIAVAVAAAGARFAVGVLAAGTLAAGTSTGSGPAADALSPGALSARSQTGGSPVAGELEVAS